MHYVTPGTGSTGAMCTMASATDPNGLNLTGTGLTAAHAGTSIDIDKTANVMQDLAVLTALCDSNRVIFMKMPPNFVYKNLGLTVESHSHLPPDRQRQHGRHVRPNALGHDPHDRQVLRAAVRVPRRQAGQLQRGNRKTVLDNTATVWFQEMSDGNSHNLNNLPILQAGSCGGYFKTGLGGQRRERRTTDMSRATATATA